MKAFLARTILLACLLPSLVAAQNASLKISGDYQNKSLSEVLTDIEKRYPIKIFYKKEWLTNLSSDVSLNEVEISRAFELLLQGTEISAIQYHDRYVVLLKEPALTADTTNNAGPGSAVAVIGQFNENTTEATISGYIRESNSGEGIIGASIFIDELALGTVTNTDGFYSLTVAPGEYNIRFSAIGWEEDNRQVVLNESGLFNIDMFEATIQLSEVTVTSEAVDRNISSVQMGTSRLDIRTAQKMPAFLGEVDIVRGLILMPGVSTVGEGATGFNVRGGSVGENLILLDDAPIFNSSHLFGFFSIFNPDLVKDATLYRGGIPAKFGGRISSMLDVKQKEGNTKSYQVRGGVGLISSRLLAEGPIVKEKGSFLVGGRLSYTDWILNRIENLDIRNSSAQFYDLNAKVNYRFDDKNSIQLSSYYSRDNFKFRSDTTFVWENLNAVFKWNHLFSPKLFSSFSAVYSSYRYLVEGRQIEKDFDLDYDITYRNAKADFSYFPNPNHQINFGISAISYSFEPGRLEPATVNSTIIPEVLETEHALESAAYVDDEFKISSRITVNYGLRYSLYQNLGAAQVFTYQEDQPRAISTITDTLQFASGKVVEDYQGFEPRLSVKYSFYNNSSVKLSYNRMRQYIHLISNTTAVSPFDIWKTSDMHIEPQTGDQIALGYFRNFMDNSLETSVEGFYKQIDNATEYKNGAELLLNNTLEADLLQGEGRSYGVEFLVRKKAGRLTGWGSYTYSRSERKINGEFPEERINGGEYFPSNWDTPHSLNITTNYKLTRRYSFSTNFTFNTGRPLTIPESIYQIDGITVPNFTRRNQARIPDYHRLDLSFTVDGNLKKRKNYDANWTFSVYNIYGRKNAFSVFFEGRNGQPQAFKLSVLGRPFAAITYNFKFL